MLTLTAGAREALARHAEEAYPHECCGVLTGVVEGDRRVARAARRAKNLDTARARDRYLMDPADRLAAEEAARAAGETVVGFYHSHPEHDAYFSRTDLERSEEYQWGEPWLPPAYVYVVVSVRGGHVVDSKAFVVDAGTSREVDVT